MKKALFLFFEGLATNVIDSQVLLHCKNMKKIGVEFEIWAFACNDQLYEDSKKRIEYAKELSNCEVKVFKGIRPAYPFSEKSNANLVKKYLKQYETSYEFIHARTDYSACVASFVTDKFIWDCRGDTKAEFEKSYKSSKNFLGKIYKRYKISMNVKHAQTSPKAIFVSNFLKNKYDYKKESFVIGCAADQNMFFYDKNLRDKAREELAFGKNDKILIYSGGMAHYQMFPQSVELFSKLGDEWKFLVLTTNTQEARRSLYMISEDKYMLKSVPIEQVNFYLNCADVGIMLREHDDLNRAASPTKYAEYSMSGLNIIFSDNIGDLENYNEQIKNRVVEKDLKNFKFSDNNRKKIAKNAGQILSKKHGLKKYKKIYCEE